MFIFPLGIFSNKTGTSELSRKWEILYSVKYVQKIDSKHTQHFPVTYHYIFKKKSVFKFFKIYLFFFALRTVELFQFLERVRFNLITTTFRWTSRLVLRTNYTTM